MAAKTCCFDAPFLNFCSTTIISSPSVFPLVFGPVRAIPTSRRAATSVAVAGTAGAAVGSEVLVANDPTVGSSMSPKKVLIPIGYGTEEMEAVIMVHLLRQAGAKVTAASVEPQLEVETSGGVKLVADTCINSCIEKKFDLIVLLGGMPGSARLRYCEVLRSITSKHAEEKRLYGAICAAPAVTLQPWGLLRRKRVTCHPAFMDKLSTFYSVKSNIQVSGELTTSRGPGTAYEFALSLVGQLLEESSAQEVKDFLLLSEHQPTKEVNEVEWLLDHPPQVLITVANGSDEIEVVTIVDILRRANVNVVVASIEKSLQILASHGTKIITDKLIDVAAESIYDLIILPGGSNGSKRLSKSKVLKKLLKEQESSERMCGAISSSLPLLQKQGLLKDKMTTEMADGVKVVIAGKLITSKGLATTIDFALAIVSKLFKHARARSVAEGLVFEYPKS